MNSIKTFRRIKKSGYVSKSIKKNCDLTLEKKIKQENQHLKAYMVLKTRFRTGTSDSIPSQHQFIGASWSNQNSSKR
jgi:hypothetical protein